VVSSVNEQKSELKGALFIGLLLLNRRAREVLTASILGLIENRVGWRESKRG
jgi:hypothetical protein